MTFWKLLRFYDFIITVTYFVVSGIEVKAKPLKSRKSKCRIGIGAKGGLTVYFASAGEGSGRAGRTSRERRRK